VCVCIHSVIYLIIDKARENKYCTSLAVFVLKRKPMQYYIFLATETLIAGVIFPEPFHELSPIFLVTNYLKKYQ